MIDTATILDSRTRDVVTIEIEIINPLQMVWAHETQSLTNAEVTDAGAGAIATTANDWKIRSKQ